MPRRSLFLAAVLPALVLTGCRSTQVATPTAPAASHEGLHATLWVQTAAEYHALALQPYAAARTQLDAALADPSWSADPEQLAAGGYEALPPAVILDVDETVLDNSAYQARLIRDGTSYNTESWNAWVREVAATAVPGALAFTRAADSLGVAVVYLTNRRNEVEEPTRRNLLALGFPIATDFDAVLTRGDVSEGSDKGPRRASVSATHRVLLNLGDNLGDFVSDDVPSPEAREQAMLDHADWWGERWFMLPNPQYGGWESALFDGDYSLSPEERAQRKVEGLKVTGSPTQ